MDVSYVTYHANVVENAAVHCNAAC
jgi:hypothetical protein